MHCNNDLNSEHSGFTLIELAIVLVIIGLIIGGVLVGQSLIGVTEARSQMNQMNAISTAVGAFRLKYGCLPGDCSSATNFGLGANGNNDGVIGLCQGAWTSGGALVHGGTGLCVSQAVDGMSVAMLRSGGESNGFFVHLSQAQLIPNQLSTNPGGDVSSSMNLYFPKSALGKGYLIAYSWNNVTFVRTGIAGTDGSGNPWTQTTGLTAGQMQYITQKLDENPQDMMNAGCIGSSTCSTPPPGLFKYRAVAMGGGVEGMAAGGFFYTSANLSVAPGLVKSCMNDNSGTYTYNLVDGDCNLLWKMDGM